MDSSTPKPPEKKRSTLREFFAVGEVFGYYFRKKNKDEVPNVNTRIMHWINKIAIIMFLLGILYVVLKHVL